MRKLTKEEADQLVASGEAGFYSVWANPPTLHSVQYVLQIESQYWLVSAEQLRIEKAGIVNLGSLPKQVHNVEMNLPDELIESFRAEMERHQRIDDGSGIPVYHTQKPSDNS